MSSLREYINESSAFTPQVDKTRCVHGKIEVSNCTDCVDICPHLAWNLSDESLSIDVSACVGCALCVAACKEMAMQYEYQHIAKNYKNLKINFFACHNASHIEPQDKNIFCINAISMLELLHLYSNGVEVICASIGNCHNCTYNCTNTFEDKITKLNDLLMSRNHKGIKFLNIKATKFKKWLAELPDFSEQNDRRMFLRNMFANSMKVMGKEKNNSHSTNLDKLLPIENNAKTNDFIYFFVPQISEHKCNICNACIRLCPHESLTLKQHQLSISANRCTGCNICVDVCEQQAIKIEPWSKVNQLSIDITTHLCNGCGVSFSVPKNAKLNTNYCLVCTHNNTSKNLYQVIDA